MLTGHQIDETRPLLIIGAGPIGLATAAKCAANGLAFHLVEAGKAAASAVADWSHVRLFSPWAECLDDDACELLGRSAWTTPPPGHYPTGRDLIRNYLGPLSRLPDIATRSSYGCRVTRIERVSGGFRAKTEGGAEIPAGAVIDASGTWATPRLLPRTGPRQSPRIFYCVPNLGKAAMRAALTAKRVAIIGSGHSGMTLLLDLVDVIGDGELLWVRRGAVVHTGAPIGPGSARLKLEQRAEQAALRPNVRLLHEVTIDQLRETAMSVEIRGRTAGGSAFTIEADYVFAALGFDPDHRIASALRLDLDGRLAAPAGLADLIDPARHSCNTVPVHGWRELAHPEPGYFIVGSKSYGRAPNFALSTGYAQVDSVLGHLAPSAFAAKADAVRASRCSAQCG